MPLREVSTRCLTPCACTRCSASAAPSSPVPPVISTVPAGSSGRPNPDSSTATRIRRGACAAPSCNDSSGSLEADSARINSGTSSSAAARSIARSRRCGCSMRAARNRPQKGRGEQDRLRIAHTERGRRDTHELAVGRAPGESKRCSRQRAHRLFERAAGAATENHDHRAARRRQLDTAHRSHGRRTEARRGFQSPDSTHARPARLRSVWRWSSRGYSGRSAPLRPTSARAARPSMQPDARAPALHHVPTSSVAVVCRPKIELHWTRSSLAQSVQ